MSAIQQQYDIKRGNAFPTWLFPAIAVPTLQIAGTFSIIRAVTLGSFSGLHTETFTISLTAPTFPTQFSTANRPATLFTSVFRGTGATATGFVVGMPGVSVMVGQGSTGTASGANTFIFPQGGRYSGIALGVTLDLYAASATVAGDLPVVVQATLVQGV